MFILQGFPLIGSQVARNVTVLLKIRERKQWVVQRVASQDAQVKTSWVL